jgi:hypothetical protein
MRTLAKLSSIGRKGQIRMVKVTLPKPQLEVELMACSHDSLREYRGVGGAVRAPRSPMAEATPVSLPEQPQIHGGKERKGNLNVSYLCLTENAGLPVPGNLKSKISGWQRSHHSTQSACRNGMGSPKDIGRQ